jgi:hypothetical protein
MELVKVKNIGFHMAAISAQWNPDPADFINPESRPEVGI